MLIALHRLLRRHRRKVLGTLVIVAALATAMTAHTVAMGELEHAGAAVSLCLTIGGCVAVIGVAAIAILRLLDRRRWRVPGPTLRSAQLALTPAAFDARAGPSPVALQVFRL